MVKAKASLVNPLFCDCGVFSEFAPKYSNRQPKICQDNNKKRMQVHYNVLQYSKYVFGASLIPLENETQTLPTLLDHKGGSQIIKMEI